MIRDVDIWFAEYTAKLINTNKIIPGLLKMLCENTLKKPSPSQERATRFRRTQTRTTAFSSAAAPNEVNKDTITEDRAGKDALTNGKAERSTSGTADIHAPPSDTADIDALVDFISSDTPSALEAKAKRKKNKKTKKKRKDSGVTPEEPDHEPLGEYEDTKGLTEESSQSTTRDTVNLDLSSLPNIPAVSESESPVIETKRESEASAAERGDDRIDDEDTTSMMEPSIRKDVQETCQDMGQQTCDSYHLSEEPVESSNQIQHEAPTSPKQTSTESLEGLDTPSSDSSSSPQADVPQTVRPFQEGSRREDFTVPTADKAQIEQPSPRSIPEAECDLFMEIPSIKSVQDNNEPEWPYFSIPETESQSTMIAEGQSLVWTYASHTDDDETLLEAGVRLWEEPPTYFHSQPVSMKTVEPTIPAPVAVSYNIMETPCPSLEFDGEVVQVIPQEQPWDDVRSYPSHPDFQPAWKLSEYQACEAAGYPVWRHDRHLLPCRKAGCEELLLDSDTSTRICLGCGPKTEVRYCSFAHQIEDLESHWSECGDSDLVIPLVIDHTTEPKDFSQYPPAIFDINGEYGIRSAKIERQKQHFMLNGGFYSLFDPLTEAPKTLFWPTGSPNSAEFNRRIERLLNIAFFDTQNLRVIFYLFRLLRKLLTSSGQWSHNTKKTFETQFLAEFNPTSRDSRDPTRLEQPYLCECDWHGGDIAPYDHHACCARRTRIRKGLQTPTFGLKTTVEQLENRYWILRAWQQQHATEKDWHVRAGGYGLIPVEPGEEIYDLGPGWTGWGGKESNARGIDWAQFHEYEKRFGG